MKILIELVQFGFDRQILMVPVPAGELWIDGCCINVAENFWLSERHISCLEWKALFGRLPDGIERTPDTKDEPVSNVNWYDAVAFCNEISQLITTNVNYRVQLPTYAEWALWNYHTEQPIGERLFKEWCLDRPGDYLNGSRFEVAVPGTVGAAWLVDNWNFVKHGEQIEVCKPSGYAPHQFRGNLAGFRLSYSTANPLVVSRQED